MVVLALDTTTRRGSVAMTRDGAIVDVASGDPAVTHGQRLPGDLVRLLERQRLGLADVDLFAVAAGPGSFTGLRIGIATMQGLAVANRKPLVGVSALDALRHAVSSQPPAVSSEMSALSPLPSALTREPDSNELAVWMDAQRGQVFSARYREASLVEGPTVEDPADILARWSGARGNGHRSMRFAGDGAVAYRDAIERALPDARIEREHPVLAPSIALLAAAQFVTDGASAPDAIRPIYVRKPDAELARDRKGRL